MLVAFSGQQGLERRVSEGKFSVQGRQVLVKESMESLFGVDRSGQHGQDPVGTQ